MGNRETPKHLENSKKRLGKIQATKLRTAFIGAISAFEEEFGYLWGHNEKRPLTQQERQFKEMWDHVRNRILDNGNNQIRALEQEIDLYTIRWDGYHIEFRVKDTGDYYEE